VNLAGVEIILNMRTKMEEMQRQMQDFVSYVTEAMGKLPSEPPDAFSTSLIPVSRNPFREREKEETPAPRRGRRASSS
jgi:MerR family transcriptional regulator/heat shock protein HspR